jgi:hypothetical protein
MGKFGVPVNEPRDTAEVFAFMAQPVGDTELQWPLACGAFILSA